MLSPSRLETVKIVMLQCNIVFWIITCFCGNSLEKALFSFSMSMSDPLTLSVWCEYSVDWLVKGAE